MTEDMLSRTWLLGLVVALAPVACKGPALCLNANCDAAVPVAVVDDAGPGGALRAGEYRFVVTTGYATTEWTCTLPGGSCDHDFFTDFEDGDDSGTLSLQAHAGERGLEVEVLETRGSVWRGPAEFVVQVERDGVLVADETLAPKYVSHGGADGCVVCLAREGDDPVVHIAD